MKTNPFRQPLMHDAYARAVSEFHSRAPIFFTPSGSPAPNSIANFFWRGYRGKTTENWNRANKNTVAYAHYCAGRDIAAGKHQAE